MALKILQDEHEKIRIDLEKELVKARNLLNEKIGENGLNEFSILCSHRISCMKTLSDALETALANILLEVEETVKIKLIRRGSNGKEKEMVKIWMF